MVFFTCNNCGSSLKKKDCAPHAGRCYPLALTCIDCHKDFYGDEYAAHTSCVTESEKYGVKGFRSPAPSTAGLAKQEEWTRAVLAVSRASGLTSGQKILLGNLIRHTNVPRKNKPFHNFAKNVWRPASRQPAIVDEVYSLIESELTKMKGLSSAEGNIEVKENTKGNVSGSVESNTASEIANGNQKEAISESSGNGAEINTNDASNLESSSAPKKDKKKKKKKRELSDEMEELKESKNGTEEQSETVENDTESKKSKKKKKRKLQVDEETVESGNGTSCDVGDAGNLDSKKSKKKRLKDKDTQGEEAITNGNGVTEEEIKKSKKKKHKDKDTQGEEAITNGNGVTEEEIKKSKKKKHKDKDTEGEEAITNGNGVAEEDSKKSKSKRKLSEGNEKGLAEAIEDFPKKSGKKKNKKSEVNDVEETGNCERKAPVGEGKKKNKKEKKHKLQEAVEDVPRKKSKPAVN